MKFIEKTLFNFPEERRASFASYNKQEEKKINELFTTIQFTALAVSYLLRKIQIKTREVL